jgi:hypothetical protein
MNILSREALLGGATLKRDTVPIDGNGNCILVRQLTANEAEIIRHKETKDLLSANVILFAMAVINEDGSRIFDPDSDEDIQLVGNLGFDLVLEVVKKVSVLSGIKKEDIDAALKN